MLRDNSSEIIQESMLTCPECGHSEIETMPVNACQFFYDCKGCGVILRPKQGDCCVFCSFGSIKCPPMQGDESYCGSSGVRQEATS